MTQKKNLFAVFVFILIQSFCVQKTIAAQLPDFVELVEKAQPSVVSISTTITVKRRNFFQQQFSGSSRGPSGSGFIISDDGYVITNNHVIDGVDKVFVSLHNGKDLEAKIVGKDAETDIALLKIEGDDFVPFKIGDINKTKVGSWVVAIGAPFGFDQTVTAGIISAKGRSVGEQYIPYVQTDVAINPGNSGGPLIDMKGQVVGVNSKILSTSGGSNGMSFSIPIDLAMDVVDQIKNDGGVNRGYLGVGYQDVSFELAKSFGLERSQGALIHHVTPGSPAERAGIKEGDIVLKIDNKSIKNATELPFIVGRYRPGDKAKFTIIRNSKKKNLKVTIGSRNGGVAGNSNPAQSQNNRLEWQGAGFKNIPDEIAERTGINRGVIVVSVADGSIAQAGIREGDIIQSVQLKAISNLQEFRQVISQLPKSGNTPVLVNRPDAGTQYVILELKD